MRMLLAIVAFMISFALIGFFGLATYEAISEWGFQEAMAEIFGFWINALIFSTGLILAAAFLCLGVTLISRPRKTMR